MRYTCVNCNYVYDEAQWDVGEWIEKGTALDVMKDHFECPVCWDGADSFQEIIEEVLYAEDLDEMDTMELDHIPEIEIDEGTAFVHVWKHEHVMWEDHYITSISLYDEYGDLVEEDFLVPWDGPIAEFDISDLDDFEIRCRCNQHGTWWYKYSNTSIL